MTDESISAVTATAVVDDIKRAVDEYMEKHWLNAGSYKGHPIKLSIL